MCGIIGCYRESGVTDEDIGKIINLIQLNSKRGPVSFGLVTPTKLFKSTQTPEIITINFMKEFVGEKYLLVHLRAPTGESQNVLDLTQPFVENENILLFNGILTEWDNVHYKNDTDFIFKNMFYQAPQDHWELCLESFKGSFALCWVNNGNMWLARCINSLYYDDNFFSSEPFKNSIELKHGEILDFKTKMIFKFEAYTPYDI